MAEPTCAVCGHEIDEEHGRLWRVAGYTRGTWTNLITHRGDCWNRRQEIKQRIPDAIIVADATDGDKVSYHTVDRHWTQDPALWAAGA